LLVSGAATFAWAADRPTRVPVAVVRLDAAFRADAFADTAFLAADFLATTFFAVAFFAIAFFAEVFVTGAGAATDVAFFAAEGRPVFFAAGFLALADDALDFADARFLAPGWLVARLVVVPSVIVASAELGSIKNLVRSFTFAIQAGGRAHPLQVWPVFGLRYFAGSFPLVAVVDEDAEDACKDAFDAPFDSAPRGRPLRAGFF
jgi:hypothetical protein